MHPPDKIPDKTHIQPAYNPTQPEEVEYSKIKRIAHTLKSFFASLQNLYNPWRPKENMAEKNTSIEHQDKPGKIQEVVNPIVNPQDIDSERSSKKPTDVHLVRTNKSLNSLDGFKIISRQVLINHLGKSEPKIDEFLESKKFEKFFYGKSDMFFAPFLSEDARKANQQEVIETYEKFDKKQEDFSELRSAIQKAKEERPNYAEDAIKAKWEFLNQFGFSKEIQNSLVESSNHFRLDELIYLQTFSDVDAQLLNIIRDELHSTLKEPCLQQFHLLCKGLDPTSTRMEGQKVVVVFPNDSEIKERSFSAMAILSFLSENLPVDDQHNDEWEMVLTAFFKVLEIKIESKSPCVQKQLGEAFQKYHTLIDDRLTVYHRRRYRTHEIEDLTTLFYGRTVQQSNEMKKENRRAVTSELLEYAKQIKEDGQPITIEMLASLHSTNNRGIVPSRISRIRETEGEDVFFGKRVGVIPKDVQPAVQEVLNKANQLIRNPPRSEFLYSIEVAKLHNRLLEIHPFMDRNGSTSLLFMELLMAAHGDYKPPEERNINYIGNLYKILNSSVAVAIVGYEHHKISNQFGYYKSKSIKIDDKARKYYEEKIAARMLEHASESKSIRTTMTHLLDNITEYMSKSN